MAWAKVDDKLHSSMKWRRASKGARALWTTALSWCSDQGNDGHVPADMLRTLDGTRVEAGSLVKAGLWDATDEGWVFHDWQDYNPDGASKKAKREAESLGGKHGNHVRWHERKRIRVPECEFCYPESGTRSGGDGVPNGEPESGANPPGPYPARTRSSGHLSSGGGTSVTREEEPPPPDEPEFNLGQILLSAGCPPWMEEDFLQALKDKGAESTTAVVIALHRKGKLAARIQEWQTERDRAAKAPKVLTTNITKTKRGADGAPVTELCAHDFEVGRCPTCRAEEAEAG